MDNQSAGAVAGTFNGLANNTVFSVGGQSLRISYFANSATGLFTGGNDVALLAVQPVPEPAFLLGGVLIGLGVAPAHRSKAC